MTKIVFAYICQMTGFTVIPCSEFMAARENYWVLQYYPTLKLEGYEFSRVLVLSYEDPNKEGTRKLFTTVITTQITPLACSRLTDWIAGCFNSV